MASRLSSLSPAVGRLSSVISVQKKRGAGLWPAPLETYTHIFFECPAFAGAKDWLLDLWQHISGVRPPDTAAAIVADEPGACPAGQQPAEERAHLWQALRLTLLRHIWAARCSSDP